MSVRFKIEHMKPWLFTAVVVVAILWLTLWPRPLPPMEIQSFVWFDKIGHFFMFAGLCFAATFDCALSRRHSSIKRSASSCAIYMCVLSVIFGALIELAQYVMPLGRTAEWADLLADILGSMASSFLSPAILRRLAPALF